MSEQPATAANPFQRPADSTGGSPAYVEALVAYFRHINIAYYRAYLAALDQQDQQP